MVIQRHLGSRAHLLRIWNLSSVRMTHLAGHLKLWHTEMAVFLTIFGSLGITESKQTLQRIEQENKKKICEILADAVSQRRLTNTFTFYNFGC